LDASDQKADKMITKNVLRHGCAFQEFHRKYFNYHWTAAKEDNKMTKGDLIQMKRRQVVLKINSLRLILFARGITQKELGAMADLSSGTVNNVIRRLETGDICDKFMKRNIKLISFALDLTPEQITGDVVVEL
jgi:DNA-binding MarR family transcriptional regulator